jgi:uncharacterized protein (TIGR02246 family)
MTTTSSRTDRGAIEQITALLRTYEQSLNTADAELAASLYTPDGIFMPHFAPTSAGSDMLGGYQGIFAQIKLAIVFHIDEISVAGDTAYALTRSQGQQTVLATGTTSPEANRELFVFQQRNGEWKIARYMFNKISPSGASV